MRPGNLDLYLELVGLEHVRRAVYRAGASLAIRYDERLIADLEAVVGAGNVRLRGQRGVTARLDSGNGPAAPALPTSSPAPVATASKDDSQFDDSLLELADEV